MEIFYINSAIAFFSALLVLNLLFILFKERKALSNQKSRDTSASLQDLLNYGSVVDDGVIVCKDGAFMAAWEYSGDDISSSIDDKRNSVSFHASRAFSSLGAGWLMHVDCIREPSPGYSAPGESQFNNPLLSAIDEERREFFQSDALYEGKFILTLTWLPPLLVESKISDLFIHDTSPKVSEKFTTANLIKTFNDECNSFESRLSNAVKLKRLKSYSFIDESGKKTFDRFLSYLHRCVTGETQPIALPNNPAFIDSLIGQKTLISGQNPVVGDKYVKIVHIGGFPSESYPGILNALSEMTFPYRWSSRFIFLDRHEAISDLEKYRTYWKQRVRGFFDVLLNNPNGTIDEHAQGMVVKSQSSIATVNSGLGQGYYTSVIVLMDENLHVVENQAALVSKLITFQGFTARIETNNSVEAYLGSLPGNGTANIRRPLINSVNLADFLPMNSVWKGESKAPCDKYQPNSPALMECVTSGNSKFYLNFHVGDLGHTMVFGQTGSGKSTFLGMSALQFMRYQKAKVFCFDKGMSMYPATMAADGQHFEIGEDNSLSFAPLANLQSKERRAWAAEWIETLVKLNDVKTDAQKRNDIAEAIENLSLHTMPGKVNSLSDFVSTVQDMEIRQALEQYTIDGLLGHLLDSEHDRFNLSNFVTFEIERLMNMGDKYALPILLYLFRQIEESMDGSPAAIFLDEAWLMLSHPVFKEKIREWLKTLRKKNCIVILATQSPSDAKRSGILDVIAESTATKIYLANPSALIPETAAIYSELGLNDKQIEVIANAVPKRDYFYTSSKGSRPFQLALGSLALAFVGKTDLDSIRELKKIIATNPSNWIGSWLNFCNVKGF